MIDLQLNEEVKLRMVTVYECLRLCKQIPLRYLTLWAAMKKLLIAVHSSLVEERGFSVVTNLAMKKRNRLEVVNRAIYHCRSRQCSPILRG
ncbi:hypothetical protein M514_00971 [Trichuris suis]|uniref:Uncharacterized protein n=1 Tax=Trichuris suis TaxID=68888 RepID=A0A085MLW2_9BILA|nr:hypothetical protein M513_00971 [Trichuris suis]KFD70472.1 hypothetical protein M514_00971 [Trichuris suis]